MCSSPLPMRLRTTAGEAPAEEPRRVDVEAEQLQNPQQPVRRQPPVKAQELAAVTAAAARQQQHQQSAAPKAEGSKQHVKSKQLVAKGQQTAAGEKGKGQEGEGRRRRGTQSLTALTALGTVALYGSVRGGISLFHHARRKFLTQLLHDLAAALNDLGVTWWLDFGSLLGIHRDGELIKHDNDVDVAVWQPDWPALLADLQAALPQYSMRIVVPSDDPDTSFIRVYCPLGMADVFGATPAGDSRVLVDCGHGSCTEIDRAAVLPTGVMTWRGSKLSVPGNVPAALEQRYGPDWRVPRYMDKGTDVVEGQKLYARIFRALSNLGIRI
ncbi:phosphate ABC transporter permease isoform A [Chlorella sorokiniana]|uniref:Phosphate ABC transporter permease isoform A n=1 Tax=Chlorella sorokiniana TaxID=3076 RepID=A0A2P6TDD2_CHLSO|nr:phosphate ABC transporter permease isoform B [Chlorella sorokiniana]PRW20649.1 phosphate ABC transporter permease isoform A [Chlorella sorokiniana]|eukprot:PRW20648.1 phosphate ABC transporter permease isoform B [Chlorella sorokiniana]